MGQDDFSDDVFEDYETVRNSGLCNMWDRLCVSEAAKAILDPECDLRIICADKKAYPRLLMAFGAWKEAQGATAQ